MSDRGEYRSFYVSILDDPDFQAMDPATFKLLFALKLSLGPAGIGVLRKLDLCERLGYSLDELESSLVVLETPKPGEERGWILRERNIVWLINGLRHERGISPNSVHHRSAIARQLKPLGDKPIVRRFKSHYHEWFVAKDGLETVGGGSRDGQEMVGDHRERERSSDHPDPKPASSEMGSTVRSRFVQTFYGSATPERRAEVEEQLTAALSPAGARIRKGEFVSARSPVHLDKCMQGVIETPPKKPDAAIVFVLRKLCDPALDNKGRTVTEAASQDTKLVERKERAYHDALAVAGRRWAKENRERYGQIEEAAKREVPGDSQIVGIMRGEWILKWIAAEIEFPDFDTWTANKAINGRIPATAGSGQQLGATP